MFLIIPLFIYSIVVILTLDSFWRNRTKINKRSLKILEKQHEERQSKVFESSLSATMTTMLKCNATRLMPYPLAASLHDDVISLLMGALDIYGLSLFVLDLCWQPFSLWSAKGKCSLDLSFNPPYPNYEELDLLFLGLSFIALLFSQFSFALLCHVVYLKMRLQIKFVQKNRCILANIKWEMKWWI